MVSSCHQRADEFTSAPVRLLGAPSRRERVERPCGCIRTCFHDFGFPLEDDHAAQGCGPRA